MLRAVGHPSVVNPDRDLARVAKEEGWPILSFNRPVRLRDRVPVPHSPLAVSGAVAAASAGVVVWWLLRRKDRAAA